MRQARFLKVRREGVALALLVLFQLIVVLPGLAHYDDLEDSHGTCHMAGGVTCDFLAIADLAIPLPLAYELSHLDSIHQEPIHLSLFERPPRRLARA